MRIQGKANVGDGCHDRDRPRPRVGSYDGSWDVPIAEVSGEASVNDARAEYEEAIKNQRVMW